MKVNRKFFNLIGLGLVGTGFVIILLGFALSGFSPESYEQNHNERPWFQTFSFYTD